MAISQNFKTQVVFGGRIDPSFSKSADGLKQAINNTSKTLSKLTNEQGKLTNEIEKAKKSGGDITELTKKYEKLGDEIKQATTEQERLNWQLKQENKWSAKKAWMKSGVSFGAGKAASAIKSGLMWGATGAAGFAVGAPAAALSMNADTAEKVAFARHYGVGVEKYSAWDNIGKMAGLNGENVGDMTEELTNKIGTAGNENTLNPMLLQLGLSKKMMANWSREKQFDVIMTRLSKMKDDKVAASLGDQLMGGEANKLLTYMKFTGKEWQEAMKEAAESNLLTQKNAEGATRAHFAMQNLWSIARSGMADMLGEISEGLAPEMKQWQTDLKGWFKEAGPEITKGIIEWMKPDENGKSGLTRFKEDAKEFGEGLYKLGRIAWALADKFSFLLPDSDEEIQKKITEGLANGSLSIGGAEGVAKGAGLEKWWREQGFTDEKVGQMRRERDEGRGGFDGLLELFKLKERATQQPPQVNNSGPVNIVVNAAPGQSSEEIGGSVYKKFDENRAKNNYGLGAMYDKPIPLG
ncbi:hypothetical protein DMA29_03165 [Salmonella enterica subsp. enterica serovar Seattle]|nr:hypothetical protein [Salmonella enterica subsp. enterica serovar Seattle]EED6909903.1 hypothetical protein [Salmonella enterica subsp. enterica serovar Lerum]